MSFKKHMMNYVKNLLKGYDECIGQNGLGGAQAEN